MEANNTVHGKQTSDLQPCQGHSHQDQRVAMLTVVIKLIII